MNPLLTIILPFPQGCWRVLSPWVRCCSDSCDPIGCQQGIFPLALLMVLQWVSLCSVHIFPFPMASASLVCSVFIFSKCWNKKRNSFFSILVISIFLFLPHRGIFFCSPEDLGGLSVCATGLASTTFMRGLARFCRTRRLHGCSHAFNEGRDTSVIEQRRWRQHD